MTDTPAADAGAPRALPNLWRVFNLRESPYFQETLGGGHRGYPLSLFVGRTDETNQILEMIGGSRSSRQGVAGPPGVGKTTLVQSVKAAAIAAGYWASTELVPFYEADTTEHVLGRLLGALYDTILAARPKLGHHASMDAAQQLVRVARLTTAGGLNVSVLGVGGGASRGVTPVTPSGAMLLDGPRIIRDLLDLVHEAGAAGVVLHLNNLENLTERAAERAADILRSLRDPVLLLDGLHILLVGTTVAVATATGAHAQVRSVFPTTLTLGPLPIDDVQALLRARYRYLAIEGHRPVPPIAAEAVAALYPLFRGDLRSLLTALEDGARLLVGVARLGASIELRDLKPTLRQRYDAVMRARLDARRQAQLDAWAKHGAARYQTQASLRPIWQITQGAVSNALADLERQGYVLALPRAGKEPIRYVLTGMARLIYG